MDTQDESTDEASPSTRTSAKPKGGLSFSRIVLFVLLAIMIGALVVDQRARRSSKAAYDALQTALGDEKKISEVKRDEVHRLVGVAPDDDGDPDDVYEQYTWQGAPYKQTVYVVYWSGKSPTLKDVSLNSAPR
jgi:hypothetical protein